jgi:biotin carboxylase
MKTIMMIGAGMLQTPVIKRARELGYRVISADANTNAEGFQYSDYHRVINIVDPEACFSYARDMKIDGVLTVATDYGVLTASYIAQQFRLPGLNLDTAKIIRNKYHVRQVLANVDGITHFFGITDVGQLKAIKADIRYAVMVKPGDGSGSRAVTRVDDSTDLTHACALAIKVSSNGLALIEEFVEGVEYGVESFVHDGEVHVLGILGKHMTEPPYYAELGHFLPSSLSIEGKVSDIVTRSIQALKIDWGAVNMDVRVRESGEVAIIDVGVRMGGNLIGSHLIPIGTGIDYMGNLIKASVGDEVDWTPRQAGLAVATRLLALTPGKVKTLPDFNKIKQDYLVEIYHHLQVGDTIPEYHNNLDGCGYVLAAAENVEDAEQRVEKAKQTVDQAIGRE